MSERRFGGKRKEVRRRWTGRLVLALIVLTAWTAGLVQFAKDLPKSVEDVSTRTNAIVVLTGGSQRLSVGFTLMANGMADRLFISGVYRGVEVKQLLDIAERSKEGASWKIEIGDADDTIGNAEETADWAKKAGIQSLRLVTAAYHMPRSLLELRHRLPKTTIIPHPVFTENVKIDSWWTWPGTARLIISEYTKYLLAKLRQVLTDLAV